MRAKVNAVGLKAGRYYPVISYYTVSDSGSNYKLIRTRDAYSDDSDFIGNWRDNATQWNFNSMLQVPYSLNNTDGYFYL